MHIRFIRNCIFVAIFCLFGCNAISGELFAPPQAPTLSKEGYALIVNSETGGQGYYNKFLKFPTVPPGYSGISWGAGFDGQFYSQDNIVRIWTKLGKENTIKLSKASGLNHSKSLKYLSEVKDILVTWDLATEVFNKETVPQYYNLALRTYPGLDELKPNAIAAVVSCVFNRGNNLVGASRVEMRDLKPAILQKDYKKMAELFRNMKRLWAGTGQEGLIIRREKESQLIETCIK